MHAELSLLVCSFSLCINLFNTKNERTKNKEQRRVLEYEDRYGNSNLVQEKILTFHSYLTFIQSSNI